MNSLIELVLWMEAIDQMPITAENIWIRTHSNQTLTCVYDYTQEDWPTNIPETLNYTVHDEQNCLHQMDVSCGKIEL